MSIVGLKTKPNWQKSKTHVTFNINVNKITFRLRGHINFYIFQKSNNICTANLLSGGQLQSFWQPF